MDLNNIKKVYVIGIKGSGVIAIVEILNSLGIEVTGSDTEEKFFTDKVLEKMGIKYSEGFSSKSIPDGVDLVIYSTAYNEKNNPEFQEAKKRNLPMASYPEILGELFNKKYGIAVCGTHGKTTTSALLASAIKNTAADPTAVIGSRVIEWGSNALIGKGDFFVIEADEFQNKLKFYDPKAVILTSLDFDHPDTYKDFTEYKKAFIDFVKKIPKSGFLVVWGDSVVTNEVSKSCPGEVIKYGFHSDNDVIVSKVLSDSLESQKFSVKFSGKDLGIFETSLVGDHNLLNAAAVIGVCCKLKLNVEKVGEGIKNFRGTSRRFEKIGKRNGAILIDDYGHHPEEIQATLKAARGIYPDKKIIAVFQPHSYSRTEALLQEFSQSFESVDKVIVLDIYGSARENSGKISSNDLSELINKYSRGKASYMPKIEEAFDFLKDKISSEDVVIAIGAGNGWELLEKLKEN
jgi:UDP-N-acetylmuramate--alanine ligase